MYKQTKWQDRVTEHEDRYKETENPDGTFTHTPVEGEIIQVGTPQNETNFNNMEAGIQDATLAAQILGWGNLHQQRRNDAHEASMDAEVLGELHTITLTNTQKFPFNSSVDSPKTIALTTTRKNLFYTVEAEVVAHTGMVGDVTVSDKALNGFKIAFTGSGSSVTLAVRSSVDSPKTIALTTTRKNLFYTVEAEVVAHTGMVGDVTVSDKALNGFKIAFTGSGSSVTLAVRVKGGMT